MSRRTRRGPPRIWHHAFFSALPNVLATNLAYERGFDRERLWKGLERFVNCGDSKEDYQALGKAYPDLWPLEGSHWMPEAHVLFLYCRQMLRRIWQGEEASIRGGSAGFLLGIHDRSLRLTVPLQRARRALGYPSAKVLELRRKAVLWPDWKTGDVLYSSQNNFQRAFYFLFRESWRARICPLCKLYFVAQKPRQKFCSMSCSTRSRLASNMDWWRRVGATRRRKKGQKRETRRRKR
jgi:hypothetical protein